MFINVPPNNFYFLLKNSESFASQALEQSALFALPPDKSVYIA